MIQDYSQMIALLRLHGIPTLHKEKQASLVNQTRQYHLLLFEQQVLYVTRTEQQSTWLFQRIDLGQKGEAVQFDQEDPEMRLVSHFAIRSLYALGLDYGIVMVGALSATRVKVIQVTSLSAQKDSLPQALQGLIEQRLQATEQLRRSAAEVTLGADPEFALREPSGKMALASDFLSKNGIVGCDSTHYREELKLNQRPLAEVRPAPTEDPDQLYLRISEALQLASSKIDAELEWLAGGMPFEGYPTGGHIHFSGVPFSFSLVRKLDNYLALPLALLEEESCRKRRPRYGFLGDFREKEHGGFEYRTLPSWLVTPEITKAVLILAKLIATNHELLSFEPFQKIRVQKAFYMGETELLRPVVRQLWQQLVSLPGYMRYQGELNAFFTMALKGIGWPANQDFRIAWKLRVPSVHAFS